MSQSINIDSAPSRVWTIITDIENCASRISGIKELEVIEKPTGDSILGLKWKETRTFAGRDATEIMWVTSVDDGAKYVTRAESHGAVYKSSMVVESAGDGAKLTMNFEGTPVSMGSKILWALTGWMMTKPMRKALQADLADLKAASEK